MTPHRPILRKKALRLALFIMNEVWAIDTISADEILDFILPTQKQAVLRFPVPVPIRIYTRSLYVIFIFAKLRIIFPYDRDLADTWILTPNKSFENQAPISFMLKHGLHGIKKVAIYLDQASRR